jgi:hypothetical protein
VARFLARGSELRCCCWLTHALSTGEGLPRPTMLLLLVFSSSAPHKVMGLKVVVGVEGVMSVLLPAMRSTVDTEAEISEAMGLTNTTMY